MVKFIVLVECTDLIIDRFNVGRAIGRLVDEYKWNYLGNSRDTSMKSDVTELGFTTRQEAELACEVIDDLGIVGLTTHAEEVVKGL